MGEGGKVVCLAAGVTSQRCSRVRILSGTTAECSPCADATYERLMLSWLQGTPVHLHAVKRSAGSGTEQGALTLRDVAQLLRQPEDEAEAEPELEGGGEAAGPSSPGRQVEVGGDAAGPSSQGRQDPPQQQQQQVEGPRQRAAAAAQARAAAAAAAAALGAA